MTSIQTEADFDRLSWHDCHLWGMYFDVGDPDYDDWTTDLVLDLDFIVEWLRPSADKFAFRVVPAALVFRGVTDPNISIDWGRSGFQASLHPVSIGEISRERVQDQKVYLDRPYYAWRVALNSTMTKPPHTLAGEFIDAVVEDPQKAVALLAEHPDLINARWIHDETVLHFLAVEGFAEGVRFLAAHGADVNAVNEFGDSPLVDVAALGIDEIAETLLRHGANPNASSATRDNVLHCAVRSGNARLVALLLSAGANPRYLTDLGESVFDAVDESPNNREAILAVLAEYGVIPDAG